MQIESRNKFPITSLSTGGGEFFTKIKSLYDYDYFGGKTTKHVELNYFKIFHLYLKKPALLCFGKKVQLVTKQGSTNKIGLHKVGR